MKRVISVKRCVGDTWVTFRLCPYEEPTETPPVGEPAGAPATAPTGTPPAGEPAGAPPAGAPSAAPPAAAPAAAPAPAISAVQRAHFQGESRDRHRPLDDEWGGEGGAYRPLVNDEWGGEGGAFSFFQKRAGPAASGGAAATPPPEATEAAGGATPPAATPPAATPPAATPPAATPPEATPPAAAIPPAAATPPGFDSGGEGALPPGGAPAPDGEDSPPATEDLLPAAFGSGTGHFLAGPMKRQCEYESRFAADGTFVPHWSAVSRCSVPCGVGLQKIMQRVTNKEDNLHCPVRDG